ncbi:MAG: immunoglobulin-like domain-containing protein, partial [bacterium]
MNNALTKKVVIIFSVLIVIVLSAIVLAFATGNTHYPQVSDPNGVFYQRLDADDNVIYSITNQELFGEIKNNDGVDQLLYLIDGYLLQDYLAALTDEEIAAKLKLLTYGTTDDAVIAEFDADTLASYEDSFAQSMILAGYSGNEEAYASIVLAREAYVRYRLDKNDEVTDDEVAAEFVGSYYEDIKALKIRFTSAADATFVMRKFHLVAYASTSLREYLGYIFTKESITYDHDNDPETAAIVADAYILADAYYYDETTQNILNLEEEIVYTYGTNGIYTDSSANEYTIDDSGNLIDDELLEVIAAEHLFDTLEDAQAYFDANSQYFTMTKTDAFDQDEEAQVFDGEGLLIYTVAFNGTVYNALHEVVAAADLDITLNKVYKTIETMGTVTVNNSRELTDAEVLGYYIDMYNYVYGEYRDAINPDATAEDLIAADNEFLSFQFTDVKAIQSSLATYMFKTLDINKEDAIPYTVTAKSYAGANDTSYYMIYKLTQPAKVDAYDIMLDYIEANIHLPAETVDNLTLPTTGWYDAKITWTTENKDYITAAGVVTLPTDADKEIDLTYKITANGVSRTGTITVKVLVSGTTSAVDTTDPGTEPTFKEILNDDVLYEQLYEKLLDAMMTATSAETTISTNMAALRTECGFALYDAWMIIDYQQIDKAFVGVEKGSKTLIATLTSRPGYLDTPAIETDFEVTADDLFAYAVGKNPALYLLYASQYDELLYSPFFTEAFGTQTDVQKNKSDRMAEMYVSLQDSKDYYSY